MLIAIVALTQTGSRADQPPATRPPFNNEVHVATDDTEVNAAIQAARRTLPVFWKAFNHPRKGETTFQLKVAMPRRHSGDRDHIWVAFIERQGDAIFGRAANDGGVWRSLHKGERGQRIAVSADQIDDWMYLRDGKIVGNYTLRVFLKRMPADQAAVLEPMLGELPQP